MAVSDKIQIRPVGKDERAAWEPLWVGYLAFYMATLVPGASDIAWARFHDPDEPMFLLGAYVDGKLTGIVHYLFDYSPDMEYLEIVGPADFGTVDAPAPAGAVVPPVTPWK